MSEPLVAGSSGSANPQAARVALITGGTRGIGAQVSRLLARAGHVVCTNYAGDRAAADRLAAAIRADGGVACPLQADVADEAQVLKMFEEIDRRFGRLDVLVNNAGVVAPRSTVQQMSVQRLNRIFSINVIGSFLCAREALKRMSRSAGGRGGSIVNISSVASKLGAAGEYVDYAASKGAIDTFTIGLAREVASEGVRVNAVLPGLIATDIHASGGQPDRLQRLSPLIPMGRPGEALEVAEAVAWLVSDQASYVTGALLDVGGGR